MCDALRTRKTKPPRSADSQRIGYCCRVRAFFSPNGVPFTLISTYSLPLFPNTSLNERSRKTGDAEVYELASATQERLVARSLWMRVFAQGFCTRGNASSFRRKDKNKCEFATPLRVSFQLRGQKGDSIFGKNPFCAPRRVYLAARSRRRGAHIHTIKITSASMLSAEDGVVDRRTSGMKNSKGGEIRDGDPVRAQENEHAEKEKCKSKNRREKEHEKKKDEPTHTRTRASTGREAAAVSINNGS